MFALNSEKNPINSWISRLITMTYDYQPFELILFSLLIAAALFVITVEPRHRYEIPNFPI